MIGLDTTTLIAFDLPDHPLHHQVRLGLRERVQEGERFAITTGVLDEYVHVVTDSRRFKTPLTISEALFCARRWISGKEISLLSPSKESKVFQWRWMEKYHLGRKRILDTSLASILFQEGVPRIATANPKDFAVFGVFEFEEWARWRT
jgi:predicted nucleic acid-binding protein